MDHTRISQEQSPFFALPKEIRLDIYELVMSSYKQVKIGNADFNEPRLSKWPSQPSICQTCQLIREESLGMYYASAVFVLNIQRPSGEDRVLTWINRLATTEAFNKIQNVSLITGWGYSEPPKEYMVDIQRCRLVLATRPCAPAYLYKYRMNMRRWSRLVSGALKKRLKQLPDKDSPGFSAAGNLRDVIAIVGELSGYGMLEGFPPVESSQSVTTLLSKESESRQIPHLLNLPKELRISIYEYALSSTTPVTIGQRALRDRELTTYPALTRASSLLRYESLPVYFSCTHFLLNIQRTPCEQIVLDWIRRCSQTYPEAFRHIQHVSVTAGSGIRQPPRQYEFYVQQNRLLSTIDRLILQPYDIPVSRWSPPPWDQLKLQLQRMPKRGDEWFDVAENLRGIIETLARYSD